MILEQVALLGEGENGPWKLRDLAAIDAPSWQGEGKVSTGPSKMCWEVL